MKGATPLMNYDDAIMFDKLPESIIKNEEKIKKS